MVSGDLTIRDVPRPVTLPIDLIGVLSDPMLEFEISAVERAKAQQG